MLIKVNVIEKENCFGFEVQIDDGRIESHASVGAWNEQAFESMCHLAAVTVHGKLLALKEAAQHCLHTNPPSALEGDGESKETAGGETRR